MCMSLYDVLAVYHLRCSPLVPQVTEVVLGQHAPVLRFCPNGRHRIETYLEKEQTWECLKGPPPGGSTVSTTSFTRHCDVRATRKKKEKGATIEVPVVTLSDRDLDQLLKAPTLNPSMSCLAFSV